MLRHLSSQVQSRSFLSRWHLLPGAKAYLDLALHNIPCHVTKTLTLHHCHLTKDEDSATERLAKIDTSALSTATSVRQALPRRILLGLFIIMSGFTAINARNPEAPAPPEAEAAASGQRKATKRRQPARKKPAAQKNGGQESADATAPERISGKGKKRANHPSEEPYPESKRHKNGSLKSSMPTTKTAVSAITTADSDETVNAKATSSSSTDAGLVSLTSMTRLNGFRYTRAQATASGGGEPQTIQSSSISFVPETSMSTVSEVFPSSTHDTSQMSDSARDCRHPGRILSILTMSMGNPEH